MAVAVAAVADAAIKESLQSQPIGFRRPEPGGAAGRGLAALRPRHRDSFQARPSLADAKVSEDPVQKFVIHLSAANFAQGADCRAHV